MKILLRSTAKWTGAIIFATSLFFTATRARARLDETCTLTVNGQTVQVGLGGVFRFNNLIAGPNLFRAYAICTSSGRTRYGRSGFVQIVANQNFSLSELDFEWRDTPFPSVNTIQAVPDAPTLTTVGQTTRVRVNAFLSDGARKEVTTRAFGSTYISSNSEIVRVDQNGLATAVAAGLAFITATNEGATAVASITVSPGDQLTTVQGFVLRQDETPVANAQVNVQQGGGAVTGPDGRFSISGVTTLQGPLSVTATSGDSLFGINSNIVPIPSGLTDAGLITLTKAVFWTLNQNGNWNTAANWSGRVVPGANDNVFINVAAAITVTHSSGTHTVKSLRCDEALVLSGGTLSFAATSALNGPFNMSGGTLGGAGEVGLNGLFTWTGGIMSGAGKTIAKSRMVITGGKTLSRKLDNAGTATTTGSITLTNNAILTNLAGAALDAQGNITIAPNLTGGRFDNFGTFIRSAGTGTTSLSSFYNSGTVEVRTGTLSYKSGTSTGSFTGLAGTKLLFDSGTVTLTSTSSISFPAVFFSLGGISVAGSYQASDSTVVSGGAANLTGTVIGVGNLLKITAGSITLSNTGGTVNIPTIRLSGGTLTGSSTVTISQLFRWTGGQMRGSGRTVVNGEYVIDAGSGKILEQRKLDLAGNTTMKATNIQLTRTGTSSASAAVLTNLASGRFDMEDGSSFTMTVSNLGFGGSFKNAGTLLKSTGTGTATIGVPFTNTGTVEVRAGTLRISNLSTGFSYTQTTGSTILNGGNITATSTTAVMNISGGSLSGFGTITSRLLNSGQIHPGLALGILNIIGNYTQTVTGSLNIEIGGLTAGSQHDQLTVSGAAALAGTLNLTRINNFTPSVGNTFVIMTYGSHGTSQFTTINGLNIGGGLRFQPVYNPTNLTLQVVPQ